MGWRHALLKSLKAYSERHRTRDIRRQEFYAEELEVIKSTTNTRGKTPENTLDREFQKLRDEGILEYVDNRGTYRLLDDWTAPAFPIHVETEELSDDAIDSAIRANRLRIGIVPTSTKQAIIRQRKGQDRLRALTVENYESRCAVCDITDSALLIASHIVGWAESPEDRGDLSNVICLCRIHDSLFEAGYWSLDNELKLLKKSAKSKTISLVLNATDRFREPREYRPAPRFVKRHRESAGFAV